jgi:hypothetical protein
MGDRESVRGLASTPGFPGWATRVTEKRMERSHP